MAGSGKPGKELKDMTESDRPRFTLNGIKAEAKVVSIYDGDTCDVVFHHPKMNDFARFKCRLSGYDAPELDEPNGELTRDYLAHLCMGQDNDTFHGRGVLDKKQLQDLLDNNKKKVYVVFGKEEKYGRALATLKTSIRGRCINDMVKEFIVQAGQKKEPGSSRKKK